MTYTGKDDDSFFIFFEWRFSADQHDWVLSPTKSKPPQKMMEDECLGFLYSFYFGSVNKLKKHMMHMLYIITHKHYFQWILCRIHVHY